MIAGIFASVMLDCLQMSFCLKHVFSHQHILSHAHIVLAVVDHLAILQSAFIAIARTHNHARFVHCITILRTSWNWPCSALSLVEDYTSPVCTLASRRPHHYWARPPLSTQRRKQITETIYHLVAATTHGLIIPHYTHREQISTTHKPQPHPP